MLTGAALPDSASMALALAQAQLAADLGEVPVGAVLVAADGHTVLGRGHNRCIVDHDPSAHAEMVALREAARHVGNYRLEGCTLYVTLEPCAMCSGALLHARLKRVVYAVPDPKTGAAGSVLDVFAQPFNHQTVVHALADEALAAQCARLLQDFFQTRRAQAKPAWLLRDDALRTPDACFDAYPEIAPAGQYVNDLPALDGLRMHYQDTDAASGSNNTRVLLCLHDLGQWGQAFAHTRQAAHAAGWRVIVPDMIGFGRSDKPKKPAWHSQARHVQVLQELMQHLGVQRAACFGCGWGLQLAQALQQTTPMDWLPVPVGMEQWLQADRALMEKANHPVWQAPFLDAGHRAAQRAFQGRP